MLDLLELDNWKYFSYVRSHILIKTIAKIKIEEKMSASVNQWTLLRGGWVWQGAPWMQKWAREESCSQAFLRRWYKIILSLPLLWPFTIDCYIFVCNDCNNFLIEVDFFLHEVAVVSYFCLQVVIKNYVHIQPVWEHDDYYAVFTCSCCPKTAITSFINLLERSFLLLNLDTHSI